MQMNYYQQILHDEKSAGAVVKRIFQIIGLVHFILATIAFIYFAFIYWVFLIIPLVIFVIGLIWGSISYVFTRDYAYVFEKGEFAVYYKTSHGKLKLILKGKARIDESETHGKKLSNKKDGVIIAVDEKRYFVSVDPLMQTLLREYE